MQISGKANPKDPRLVTQFYYSQTFPYLIMKSHQEIRRRLKDVPEALRQRQLARLIHDGAELGVAEVA